MIIHLNCPHVNDGWCLTCVQELALKHSQETVELREKYDKLIVAYSEAVAGETEMQELERLRAEKAKLKEQANLGPLLSNPSFIATAPTDIPRLTAALRVLVKFTQEVSRERHVGQASAPFPTPLAVRAEAVLNKAAAIVTEGKG